MSQVLKWEWADEGSLDRCMVVEAAHYDRVVDENAKLRDSLRRLSNEAAGMLGYGGQALRDLVGNTNCAVLESKVNDARVVLVMTAADAVSARATGEPE